MHVHVHVGWVSVIAGAVGVSLAVRSETTSNMGRHRNKYKQNVTEGKQLKAATLRTRASASDSAMAKHLVSSDSFSSGDPASGMLLRVAGSFPFHEYSYVCPFRRCRRGKF